MYSLLKMSWITTSQIFLLLRSVVESSLISEPGHMLDFDSPHVSLVPYTFSLDSETHQLETTWMVSTDSGDTRDIRVSSICAYGTVSMMEMGWNGDSKELSSGNSWAVNCRQSQIEENRLEVDVDVTKFRVQPFKSYKVCISLEDDYTMDWSLEPACTHLFSFEKYVPYVPDPEPQHADDMLTDKDDTKEVTSDLQKQIESEQKQEERETKIIESVLKRQLSNIENFVSDDFKAKYDELKDEFIEKVEEKLEHRSSSDSRHRHPSLLVIISILLARTLTHMLHH